MSSKQVTPNIITKSDSQEKKPKIDISVADVHFPNLPLLTSPFKFFLLFENNKICNFESW